MRDLSPKIDITLDDLASGAKTKSGPASTRSKTGTDPSNRPFTATSGAASGTGVETDVVMGEGVAAHQAKTVVKASPAVPAGPTWLLDCLSFVREAVRDTPAGIALMEKYAEFEAALLYPVSPPH